MKNIRFICGILCLTLLLPLAACSGGEAGGQEDIPASGEPASAAASSGSEAQPPGSGGTVELECFLVKVQALKVEEDIAKLFSGEYPGVTVRFVATPDAETALFARIASNEVPDIMNTYPAEAVYRSMMDDGLFVDLTGHEMLDNVSEATLALSEYNGKQYALPLAMSSYGVYYNKDIFAEHGAKVPSNYEEFLTACQILQDKGVLPIVFSDKSAGTVGQMAERFMGILDNDSDALFRRVANGETDLTRQAEVRTLGECLLKIREFGQKDQLGTDQDQAISDFVTGKAAMFIGGTWNVTPMLEVNKDLNFSMFPFPNPAGTGESLPVNIDTSYSVHTGAVDVDAAVDFVAFHSRTEIAQMYADVEGSPNIIKGVQYNIEQLRPVNDVIMRGEMFLTPINFWPPGMRANWEQYLQQLFIDKDVDGFVQASENMIKEFYNG